MQTQGAQRDSSKWSKAGVNWNSVRRKARRERNRLLLNELKSKPCTDCGRSFHPDCMDFHHEGAKREEISRLRDDTLKKLLDEVAQCVLLCACCHRLRHVRQG
jgi:hypothetical protein